MDSLLVKNQKRKKRKTRKNLDAIRKKARQSLFDTNFNNDSSSKNKCIDTNPSICITNNRLTLFRKAIRSDTVSRTIISKVKIKTKVEDNSNSNNKVLKILPKPVKEHVFNIFSANSGNQDVNFVSNNRKNIDVGADKTLNSVILFSPLHHNQHVNTSENLVLDTQQSDCVLSDLSPVNNVYSENNLYNKLMNNISNYLQQTASIFLKTDVIRNCKNSLRSLYTKDEYFKNEDPSLNFDLTHIYSDGESIIHSPKDYIGYSHQEVSKRELVTRPIKSMVSNSSISQSSSTLSLIISDSPEYTYYPHRLNQ